MVNRKRVVCTQKTTRDSSFGRIAQSCARLLERGSTHYLARGYTHYLASAQVPDARHARLRRELNFWTLNFSWSIARGSSARRRARVKSCTTKSSSCCSATSSSFPGALQSEYSFAACFIVLVVVLVVADHRCSPVSHAAVRVLRARACQCPAQALQKVPPHRCARTSGYAACARLLPCAQARFPGTRAYARLGNVDATAHDAGVLGTPYARLVHPRLAYSPCAPRTLTARIPVARHAVVRCTPLL